MSFMGFFSKMGDMAKMVSEAKKIKQKMESFEADLNTQRFVGASEGVEVTVNGKKILKDVAAKGPNAHHVCKVALLKAYEQACRDADIYEKKQRAELSIPKIPSF